MQNIEIFFEVYLPKFEFGSDILFLFLLMEKNSTLYRGYGLCIPTHVKMDRVRL